MALLLPLVCVGCANSFNAPFKPATGFVITDYTVPLTVNPAAVDASSLAKYKVDSFYLLWPYPTVDVAWTETASFLPPRGSRLASVEYADLEVFTVLGMFGRYRVNYYGKPNAPAVEQPSSASPMIDL